MLVPPHSGAGTREGGGPPAANPTNFLVLMAPVLVDQQVTALVQLRDGARLNLDQLDAHCRPRLAAYKLPRHLVIVERAQRSPSGKPDYEWARRMATAGEAAG